MDVVVSDDGSNRIGNRGDSLFRSADEIFFDCYCDSSGCVCSTCDDMAKTCCGGKDEEREGEDNDEIDVLENAAVEDQHIVDQSTTDK